jgi:hypothetical protein
MSDLTLKHTFIDRGGAQVYDVIKEPTEYLPADCLGQVRIPPDPRIKELEADLVEKDDWVQEIDALAVKLQAQLKAMPCYFDWFWSDAMDLDSPNCPACAAQEAGE